MPVRQEWSTIDLCGADRRKKIGKDGNEPLGGHFVIEEIMHWTGNFKI